MPDQHVDPLVRLEADAASGAAAWIGAHRTPILEAVREHGAVLVQGLPTSDRDTAVAAVRAVIADGMPEREGFAPRDALAPGVYSSSHWPDDQPMCMHHELSYAATVPRLLAFACVTPPASGGITALADARAVLRDLPADLVGRFERHGWRLHRHYNPYVGTSWRDAFGTESREDVDRYCAEHGVEAIWHGDDTLSTVQTRPAILEHPDTGERSWFNQIAFLNEWTMEPAVREFLVAEFGIEALPFNTFFGDGAPLDRVMVDAINEAYEKHTVRRPWQRGDLLVVDNTRMAHSREPFQGDREIVVGMGEPFRR
ncbi:TauD/TfdA family dioxygenase [Streptomyces sp. WAC04114]|uniref:TauD/TfdA family dioxygenase n=1 Tax=Streptomyces sp. WAC04114 TaxID=2867961 RepID=UPI001C8CD314|nr:TauD/TfdA family dioxygenase [Streptomyces sp. WAC04114]MBX9364605.1 TauD/TfdA family dioxygenase [Streptomyces sp. WAC04114]